MTRSSKKRWSRVRALVITIGLSLLANMAISYASGVAIIPDAPRPKSGVAIIPDAPRPKSGVAIIPDAPRPKSGVPIVPDAPKP